MEARYMMATSPDIQEKALQDSKKCAEDRS